MGSSKFHFKQFSILQDGAAMKLGIDSVTLGALCHSERPQRILDIGTGTGLLALMMAQKFPNSTIDAIEVDTDAAQCAQLNVRNSPFNNITVYHTSLQNFKHPSTYDLIICNPPYFTEDIKPENEARKTARHHHTLSLTELFHYAAKLIGKQGALWIIYPTQNWEACLKEMNKNELFLHEYISVKHNKNKASKRFVAKICPKETPQIRKEDLILKDGDAYSLKFKKITHDFYLNL